MAKICLNDLKILAHITRDADINFSEVSRLCNVSVSLVYQQIRKLKKDGVIKSSHYVVDPEIFGFKICAFVFVQLEDGHTYSKVSLEIAKIKEIVECHFVTGEYPILLKMYCRDNDHLQSVVANNIHKLSGVSKIIIHSSFDQAFERQIYIESK